jgi:demethylmenaquinone methyltransferase/2-methoxy-6-polyprenyl-1,4-benzoquinol methylase
MEVCHEIERVLKPGGCFYHADMLRPANKIVEQGYYLYLRFFLHFTAVLLGSSESSHRCKAYFIDALRMFYSVDEITDMLHDVGFEPVSSQPLLAGTIGYHRAMKSDQVGQNT